MLDLANPRDILRVFKFAHPTRITAMTTSAPSGTLNCSGIISDTRVPVFLHVHLMGLET